MAVSFHQNLFPPLLIWTLFFCIWCFGLSFNRHHPAASLSPLWLTVCTLAVTNSKFKQYSWSSIFFFLISLYLGRLEKKEAYV